MTLRALFRVVAAAALLVGAPLAADAMPPFAQAYGVSCSLCHTQVPALNSYGRYVQRTGYASLDPHVLRHAFPFWIGESANLDSTDSVNPNKITFGNLAIHAVGFLGNDVSYHLHTWITQDNQPGTVDTFWLAYNNLLHRDGHLFVGKIESPGPSAYSQWMDLSGFVPPAITVGEHAYELDGNRWGAKFDYVHKAVDLTAGWLGSGEDLGGVSNFSNTTDKTFMWQALYAPPTQPWGVGYVGSRGSWPLSDGNFDQYAATMFYAQSDPLPHGVPGFLVLYQTARDGNAGPGFGPAFSHASSFELLEPFMHDQRAMLSLRKEYSNDGLGTNLQSGIVDLSYRLGPYLRFYAESAMAQDSTPSWRYMLWWTTPVRGPIP
jgi:hypothetical protein